jgi:hypothetical protein
MDYIVRNKRNRKGYAACYTYFHSFGTQLCYVYHKADAHAVDLLLAAGLQRQAVMLIDASPSNTHRHIKSNK